MYKAYAVYGGTSYSLQRSQISRGIDVLVATPGRLMDLQNSGSIDLSECGIMVLDEADRMLDMGFQQDVETIYKLLPEPSETADYPPKRINMLWSATVPSWVHKLASRYCDKPEFVDLVGEDAGKIPDTISFKAITVSPSTRKSAFVAVSKSAASGGNKRVLVFTETKREAMELATLPEFSDLSVEPLMGDLSQQQRDRALSGFKNGTVNILICTDVAARGLDIPEVQTVIHYTLPRGDDSFVHRSGRTGRAGRTGNVYLLADRQEYRSLFSLENRMGITFDVVPAAAAPTTEAAENAITQIEKDIVSFPADFLHLVKDSGIYDKVMKLCNNSESVALQRLLACNIAKGMGYADGTRFSLLSGESGAVTLALNPLHASFIELTGEHSHMYGAKKYEDLPKIFRNNDVSANPTACAGVVKALLASCNMPSDAKPARVIASNDCIVFDIPVKHYAALNAALVDIATTNNIDASDTEKVLAPVSTLPSSIKKALGGSSGGGYDRDNRRYRDRDGNGYDRERRYSRDNNRRDRDSYGGDNRRDRERSYGDDNRRRDRDSSSGGSSYGNNREEDRSYSRSPRRDANSGGGREEYGRGGNRGGKSSSYRY